MAATSPPPDPALLMDELVEECLLRLPPEDPADLARAALVSRQWHRVVTGAGFRRRYIEFHRSPPLLGYFLNLGCSICFEPLSSSFCPPHAYRRDVKAVHSSHGRVLLLSIQDLETEDLYLFVWDPVTDKEWELPVLVSTGDPYTFSWDAALVCAVGDGCCHVDCHFKVVVVGISGELMFYCFYSSEADSWSDRIFVSGEVFGHMMMGSVLVGNTLYFRVESNSPEEARIFVEYDLLTHQSCMISLQCEDELSMGGKLIATEDGRLGVAVTSKSTLRLWLREQGRLAESRVIQLDALLPDDTLTLFPSEALIAKSQVAAFAQTGAGVIFLCTHVGYFTIDLDSGRSKKVGECSGLLYTVPYVSFCTPAPGTVSTDEGPGPSVVVSTGDEPGASVTVSRGELPGDVAVSTDEGPGDVVVVSIDEGPGPSLSS